MRDCGRATAGFIKLCHERTEKAEQEQQSKGVADASKENVLQSVHQGHMIRNDHEQCAKRANDQHGSADVG